MQYDIPNILILFQHSSGMTSPPYSMKPSSPAYQQSPTSVSQGGAGCSVPSVTVTSTVNTDTIMMSREPSTRGAGNQGNNVTSRPRDVTSHHDQSKLVIDALSSLNEIKDIDVKEFDMYLPRDGQDDGTGKP